MSVFNSYGPCRGITLFRYEQLRVELWYIPAGYDIVEHRHPKEDVELMYIFGSSAFFRRDIRVGMPEMFEPKFPRDLFKTFSVKHFHSHWFSVGKIPLVFINFQTFLAGNEPVSAADDFLI